MKVTIQDIIGLMTKIMEDDRTLVENYKKVSGILDKINKEQAEAIFQNLINNHELSNQDTKMFQAKSNLFANQAKKAGVMPNPIELQKLEGMQEEAERLSQERNDLELSIGKTMLEKGFIDQKTYDKYYPS